MATGNSAYNNGIGGKRGGFPNAQRKYKSNPKIKRALAAGACCQAERRAANSFEMGAGGIT